MRSPSARVLVALVKGLALGAAIAASGNRALAALPAAIEPVGTLWLNAIRMLVVPLLVALVVVGVASAAGAGAIGRLGWRGLLFFLALFVVSATTATVVARVAFARLAIEPATVASMRARVAGADTLAAVRAPAPSELLVGIVPTNPVKAAADGTLLPVIVFALALGLALTRVAPATRDPALRLFHGVADATLEVVRWIMLAAPVGIFALALALAARVGLSAAGALAFYVVTLSALLIAFTLAFYPLVAVLGRYPLRRFARGILPAQAVAFGTRSSIAALPAMIEAADRRLALPPAMSGFVLPLATAMMTFSTTIAQPTASAFVARLYGIELGVPQLAMIVALATLLSLSAPGIPSGTLFVTVPLFLAVGLPLEAVAMLLAVDAIPDIFKTVVNVTSRLSAATVLARFG